MNPLQIEIVSDVVCPWCFIGLRRLDAALALVSETQPGFQYAKRWRPFFLNPDTPPEGEPYRPFLLKKFGGKENLDAIFNRVREAGATCGLEYHFDKIQVRANTLNAHRLIHWAQAKGPAHTLVERLFVGQFQRGENVGDQTILVRIAEECGYDPAVVTAYLESDEDASVVRQLAAESQAWGISSVPTFVFNRKLAVPGAEDPRLLAEAITQTLS